MAKTRQQKEEIVSTLVDNIGRAKSIVFVDFHGLNVTDTQAFRVKCREEGLAYMVAKKTLVNLALNKSNVKDLDVTQFDKSVASLFSFDDVVASAKTAAEFAKDHQGMTILGGLMMESPEGERALSVQSISALAKLPGKQQLLGQLVGTLNAPVSGFVNVLAGNIRGLVTALNAIKEQKA